MKRIVVHLPKNDAHPSMICEDGRVTLPWSKRLSSDSCDLPLPILSVVRKTPILEFSRTFNLCIFYDVQWGNSQTAVASI